MAETTAIEWADATLNLWWGCTKVSDGCKHCYADTLSTRFGHDSWGPKGTRREVKGWRDTLRKISKRAKTEGLRLRVFCQSMSDTFEGPETCGGLNSANWTLMSRLREDLMAAIDEYPDLDFLLLTKRPENILQFGSYGMRWAQDGIPPNAWIGTSVENQETADQRIPHLLKINASVRFLSCEPLLGSVDLIQPNPSTEVYKLDWLRGTCESPFGSPLNLPNRIDWVICGGESGPKARPMHPEWARSLRNQCQAAGVPFFFKQWGEWHPRLRNGVWPDGRGNGFETCDHLETYWVAKAGLHLDGRLDSSGPGSALMKRVGKKAAGRLLDGQPWSEVPAET